MVKILIVNNAEPGITAFADSIEKIVTNFGAVSTVIEYAACNNYPVNEFDGIILTGSPQGDDIIEHHAPYFGWIKECTIPVLGICAGHHITGFLFGSEILRSKEPESGDGEIEVLVSDPIFYDMEKNLTVRQMHNDSVTLPSNFTLLATSPICKNQMMKHKNKPIYTCQFHPEFYNHRLIANFIGLCSGL